jgi:pimeloyl-ACP methyl ester carboxylesterase
VHSMPHATLHEMRTGHLPFMDQPQACGPVINEFLRRNGK